MTNTRNASIHNRPHDLEHERNRRANDGHAEQLLTGSTFYVLVFLIVQALMLGMYALLAATGHVVG